MERLTAGTETVWLIASEVDLWDKRGLVQAWLEQSGVGGGPGALCRSVSLRVQTSLTPLDRLPIICYHCGNKNRKYRRCGMKVQVGMEAPDFELESHLDDTVRLSEYRGKHNVLIAFFPLAWTPV